MSLQGTTGTAFLFFAILHSLGVICLFTLCSLTSESTTNHGIRDCQTWHGFPEIARDVGEYLIAPTKIID
jgi:hypothetical protein